MGLKFLNTEVTGKTLVDGKTVFTVPQKAYLDFMTGQGVPEATLRSVHAAHTALVNEATQFISGEMIAHPSKNKDGELCSSKVVINTIGGTISAEATPFAHHTKPHDKDTPADQIEHVTKFGVVRIKQDMFVPAECKAVTDQVAVDAEKAFSKQATASRPSGLKLVNAA